jgi:hypothetical protein
MRLFAHLEGRTPGRQKTPQSSRGAWGNVCINQVVLPVARGPKRKNEPLGGINKRGMGPCIGAAFLRRSRKNAMPFYDGEKRKAHGKVWPSNPIEQAGFCPIELRE